MAGKIFPIVLALIGLGAGVGAGVALRAEPEIPIAPEPGSDPSAFDLPEANEPDPVGSSHDYVKLNNQFIIPVVDEGRVTSLVVLSLSLEVATGQSEIIYQREPKLRDAFMQVMFDHANAGGFNGSFTNTTPMKVLRNALREIAQKTLGPVVSDVLILGIMRQDT